MQRYKVTLTREIDADSAEEAALLMYQELSREPAPFQYTVTDETGSSSELTLDQEKADAFAEVDHTADPGNW